MEQREAPINLSEQRMARLVQKRLALRARLAEVDGEIGRLDILMGKKPQETFWDSWGNDIRHNPTGVLNPPHFDGRRLQAVEKPDTMSGPPYESLLQ